VRLATAREEQKLRLVKHVREKDESCKCIKWVQACINKFRKTATIAVDKEK
jgi:hypothetical protein